MRILGVDCGSECTGYGVIESDGSRHSAVKIGEVRTKASQPLAERLRQIGDALSLVIEQWQPECAAVEGVFHSVNSQSALKLAHVRGAVLYLMARANMPVFEYSPAEVKMSVVGHGRADKDQVQVMVRALVGHRGPFSSPDAADAVAVAICHAQQCSSLLLRK